MDGEDDIGDGGGDNAFLLTIVGITGVRGSVAEVLVNGGWGIVFGCLMVSMLTAWPCVLARNIPPLVAWCWRWVSLRSSWCVPLGGWNPPSIAVLTGPDCFRFFVCCCLLSICCWDRMAYHLEIPERTSISSMFPKPPHATSYIVSLDDAGCVLAGYLTVTLLVSVAGVPSGVCSR